MRYQQKHPIKCCMVNITDRRPGYSLAVKLKETQNNVNSVNGLGKLFGITPLTAESQSWYTGMVGEVRVGETLNRLRAEGWNVYHSVPIGDKGSDIDHVAVSPSGKIFTINTKRHPGKKIKYYAKKMYVNGQPTDHIRNSVYEMNRVRKTANSKFSVDVYVKSVLVFVDTAEVVSMQKGNEQKIEVMIANANNVLTLLRKAEQETVTELYPVQDLTEYSFWTKTVEEEEDQDAVFAWFNVLSRNVFKSQNRKTVWLLGVPAVGIGAYFFMNFML